MSIDYSTRQDYAWHSTEYDWHKARVITAGIDVGSTTSQAVILGDHAIIAYSNIWTGADNPDSPQEALEAALKGTVLKSNAINFIIGTGCGAVNIPNVTRTVSEIACHARGANYAVGPKLKTVLAMGARDCAAISCRDTGTVISFLTNASRPAVCRDNLCNACGAAQGQAIDTVAELLSIPIDEAGALSLSANEQELTARLSMPYDQREQIQDQMLEEIASEILAQGGSSPLSGALGVVCSVLARTQAAGLLRNGWSKSEILAAYCAALAHQASLLVKRLGLQEELALTGGVAKNIGVMTRIETELGIKAVEIEPDPQITAALGAALYAHSFAYT
jgi:activator of 2-hydroxyglutaryl-CoA dehydratase